MRGGGAGRGQGGLGRIMVHRLGYQVELPHGELRGKEALPFVFACVTLVVTLVVAAFLSFGFCTRPYRTRHSKSTGVYKAAKGAVVAKISSHLAATPRRCGISHDLLSQVGQHASWNFDAAAMVENHAISAPPVPF